LEPLTPPPPVPVPVPVPAPTPPPVPIPVPVPAPIPRGADVPRSPQSVPAPAAISQGTNAPGSPQASSPGGSGSGPGLPRPAAAAKSVVFVIDRSSSMGFGDKLGAARQLVLATLARLSASARFQVVVYNRQAATLRLGGRTELVPVTPGNLGDVAKQLDELAA